MKTNWLDKVDCFKLVMLSLLSFVIENTIGIVLLPFSATPLIGGIASGFFDAAVIFIAVLIVPRRPAGLLFALVLLSLSTLTASFGPPGWHKILIGVALGLTVDIVREILGRSSPISNIVAVSLAFAASVPCTFLAWKWFGPPGFEAVEKHMLWMSCVYGVIGMLGSSFGYWIFHKRLRYYPVVQRSRELGDGSESGNSRNIV